ncbi:SAM-dependent methyltransferase [Endozoicomonadaceae bacterium StTr2]
MWISAFLLGVFCTWLIMSGVLGYGLRMFQQNILGVRQGRLESEDRWLLNTGPSARSDWHLLGYWRDAATYPKACQELAGLVADKACLSPGDRVLDAGFTSLDQLRMWRDYYQVEQIVGLTDDEQLLESGRGRFDESGEIRLQLGNEKILRQREADSVNKVIALDSAVSFERRPVFLEQANRLLTKDGVLVMTDFIQSRPCNDAREARKLRLLSAARGIHQDTLKTEDQYLKLLNEAGFDQVEMLDLTEDVISGFCYWFSQHHENLGSMIRSKLWWRLRIGVGFMRWGVYHDLISYKLVVAKRSSEPKPQELDRS